MDLSFQLGKSRRRKSMKAQEKTYTVEELDSLLNKASKGRAIIVVKMEEKNGIIENSVMQAGSEGCMNSWAAVAAAFSLIECVTLNVPEMGKILSEYITKPSAERKKVLEAVLERALVRERQREMEKSNGN
jgi:uncharacterized protein YllA (UPF0747 family)